LLRQTRTDAVIFDSAKMTLEEVIGQMLAAESEGKTTVRLHTGDPCVYGAIQEQIDILKREHIAFDLCPGVSSFCGAAAALEAEYTLPGVSQSVVITRMEGRTPVPEREKIASWAAHGATMVIFLSSGMTDKLQKQLLEGGYEADTPAAIVYKATWPDQKVVHCTVGSLAAAAQENGIKNLALITVGYFLQSDYQRSKLYDPQFTTLFRQGNQQ
ncbi:MAG: cobalt-precorrin-4/precorrin-4 C(11)-methyltransferase, partial [Clostridiales bacterium]